ncbi:hypothetical protein [Nocardia sp. bgisy134]|uniref:T4 family baseplate hub assembly chaperone n=1 Tax=Nocardia sp. bgisy134 TaxID=3413789 RepID=UPI003D72D20A
MSTVRGLAAQEALVVWERGGRLPAATRSAAVLDAIRLVRNERGAAAALPLGECDAALLRLYAATFGDRIDALASCQSCAIDVELTISCVELLDGAHGVPVQPVEESGYVVEWRLPTSTDLASLGACRDVSEGAELLLHRCVLETRIDGSRVTTADLPPEVRDAVCAAMVAADPLAEIILMLQCPECGHRWSSRVDIGMLFERCVRTAALRVLNDIHTLARSYGWSESRILDLSPARRAAYLELVSDA